MVEPNKFLNSKNCSADFRVLIEREALGVKYPEDKKRSSDYVKYANKFGFGWEDRSDIGFLHYDYKAKLIMRLMFDYARQLVQSIGLPVYEISGSNFFDMRHPAVKAYASLFGDRLFQFQADDKALVMSYDSSYPHFNDAGKLKMRESHLPFGHFSLADCYRFEQKGECMLLFRGRRFHMADLHPYFKDVAEAFNWYFKIEEKLLQSVSSVNRKYVRLAKVSNVENWEKYRDEISEIAKQNNEPVLVEIRMDGQDRYWIIDVDYSIIDQYKHAREIGCIQIDVGNAKRLDISHSDKRGQMRHPVIIHAAVPGGIERFLYMLFDNFKVSFPLWLHPVQLRLIPVGEKYVGYCKDLANRFPNIRIEIDERAESVAKRIKRVREDLVPHHLVIGEKEHEEQGRAVKKKIQALHKEIKGYPFIPLSWPKEVNKQIR